MRKSFFASITILMCVMIHLSAETLTLDKLLVDALKNNPEIMIQLHAVTAAKHKLRAAGSPADFKVSISADYTDNTLPISAKDTSNSEVPVGDGTLLKSSYDTNVIQGNISFEKNFTFGLQTKLSFIAESTNEKYEFSSDMSDYSVIQNLYDPERRAYGTVSFTMSLPLLKSFSNSLVSHNINSAQSFLYQQQLVLENKIADVIKNVSSLYWTYVINVQTCAQNSEVLDNLKKRREQLQALIDIGSSAQSEMVLLSSNIEKQIVANIISEQSVAESAAALSSAIGYEIPVNATVNSDALVFDSLSLIDITNFPDDVWLSLYARAETQNNEIKLADERVRAAEILWRSARIAAYPDFDVFVSVGHKGTKYDNNPLGLFQSFATNVEHLNFSGGFVFSASLPNNAKGNADAAYEEFLSAESALIVAKEKAKRDLRVAVASVNRNVIALKKSRHVVDLYSSIAAGERKRFDAGLITVDALYSMEETNMDVRSSYYRAFYSYTESVLALKKLLGVISFAMPGSNGENDNSIIERTLYLFDDLFSSQGIIAK